jgi:hypothetical protein
MPFWSGSCGCGLRLQGDGLARAKELASLLVELDFAEPERWIFVPQVGAAARQIDPQLALADVRSMEAVVADSVRTQRLGVVLVAGFSLATLLLATMGSRVRPSCCWDCCSPCPASTWRAARSAGCPAA